MIMRKIGILSGAYTDELERYTRLRADGFEAVDYQELCNTNTELFTSGIAEFERRLKTERSAAEAAGVLISQTHGPWRWPVHDSTEAERAERMEKMKLSLYGTALLGCKYMALHPIMPFGASMEDDTNTERFFEMNREFYSELIEAARQNDVVICFENMPMVHLPIASPKTTSDFIRSFNSEHFKMCLDTGHGIIHGENPGDTIRRDHDIIKMLHVHDNDGRSDFHWLPYNGVIDWADFTGSLELLDESVVMALECSVPKKMPEPTLTVCRKALAKVAQQLAGRQRA